MLLGEIRAEYLAIIPWTLFAESRLKNNDGTFTASEAILVETLRIWRLPPGFPKD